MWGGQASNLRPTDHESAQSHITDLLESTPVLPDAHAEAPRCLTDGPARFLPIVLELLASQANDRADA